MVLKFAATFTVALLLVLKNDTLMASTCYGTTQNGRLTGGVKLPSSGENFVSYGRIPELAGRTYVHSLVKKIVLDSYKNLNQSLPNTKFKYAETGFEKGGQFKPHKTHRNGLSIDFMVPVTNEKSESVYFSTSPLNRYGYDVAFDKMGRYKSLSIDFEAMAAHLVSLHKMALENKADLWRVLFDPRLQKKLYATRLGKYIKNNIHIPNKKSWVRHDEHYHVDFKIKCKKP